MYSKRLLSKQALYFLHAPPMTGLDDITSDDLPNLPFKGAHSHMRSVYYYWWAFLRENEEYITCCTNGGTGKFSNLYSDFGDVRDEDFFGWWKNIGRHLFCEPNRSFIRVIRPSTEIKTDEVALAISVTGDLDRAVSEVRALLKDVFRRARQKNQLKTGTSGAKYPVSGHPQLASLHQGLLFIKAQRQNKHAPLIELAKMANLQFAREFSSVDADRMSSIRSSISRIKRQSNKILENVVLGKFPIIS
ncbi:MAG: hypothetical protein EBY22_16930 [Gammaproteobacteria bacterium]|nr:hypothetical protein [Gammaproteobacteria bacterium]